jgi:hypothetical protein
MTEAQVREVLRRAAERIDAEGGVAPPGGLYEDLVPFTELELRAMLVGVSLLLNERHARGIA